MQSLFPDICSEDVAASRDFYVRLFGFEVAFEIDWYVQLRSPADPNLQLAFVRRDHASVPEGFGERPRGVLVTIETKDVDAVHARARELGIEIVYERELARREQALRSIQHLARAGSLTPYEITLCEAPALRVARRTMETTVDRLVPETTEEVYRLLGELRSAGWKEEGPVLCENEDADEDGHQVVHVCAAVAGPFRIAGVEIAELPGGAFAWLLHEGPFETLGLAYHALHAFAQERGHERRGPMREIYVNDPAEVPPEQIRTEVWMPI